MLLHSHGWENNKLGVTPIQWMQLLLEKNSNFPRKRGKAKETLLPSNFKTASKSNVDIELCIRTLHRSALFSIYKRKLRSEIGAFMSLETVR